MRNPQSKYLTFSPDSSFVCESKFAGPTKQIQWELAKNPYDDTTLLENSIKTLSGAKLIGTTENLDSFQKHLCAMLKIPSLGPVKLNARSNVEYNVSTSIEEKIRYEICAVDQKIYNLAAAIA